MSSATAVVFIAKTDMAVEIASLSLLIMATPYALPIKKLLFPSSLYNLG